MKFLMLKAAMPRRLLCGKQYFRQNSTSEFEAGSNLTNVNDGEYTIQFNNDWSVGDALNGGYLMAVALKAAQNCVNNLDPLSFTGYYMNKGLENTPATVTVAKLNESKSTSTVQVRISQLGLLRTQYMGVFGDLSAMKGFSHNKMTAPDLPPLEECIDGITMLRSVLGKGMTIGQRMDFRLSANSPYARGLLVNQRSEQAVLECWVAFEDGHDPCIRSLGLFSDSYPPCVLNLTQFAWVPTLEYGVHFWSRPEHDTKVGRYNNKQWIRARYYVDHVINGMLFTDGELWSADGKTLLATSRQLARVLIPR